MRPFEKEYTDQFRAFQELLLGSKVFSYLGSVCFPCSKWKRMRLIGKVPGFERPHQFLWTAKTALFLRFLGWKRVCLDRGLLASWAGGWAPDVLHVGPAGLFGCSLANLVTSTGQVFLGRMSSCISPFSKLSKHCDLIARQILKSRMHFPICKRASLLNAKVDEILQLDNEVGPTIALVLLACLIHTAIYLLLHSYK